MKSRFLHIALMWLAFFCLVSAAPAQQGFGKINKEEWEKSKEGISYKPMKEKEPEEKEEQEKKVDDSNSSGSSVKLPTFDSSAATMVFYALIVAILAVVIGVLIKNSSGGNKEVARQQLYNQLDEEENIDETDLDAYLKKALELPDYSLALRIKYLMIIKALSLTGYIKWSKEKTNGEYLMEVYERPFFGEFRNTTNAFEHVWYGEIPFSEEQFIPLSKRFDHLINTISPNE